jgi:2-keto-4-pentenoate hydratase
MRQEAIDEAVRLLVGARRSGERLDALPEGTRPADLAEAHAIQDATVAALGDRVAGWKVSIAPAGVMRGIILQSCLVESPAVRPASQVPLLGIEGEIAFRFERDLPPRDRDYSRDEIADAATALVGIEIVSSRFQSYEQTPALHRTADFMSNGLYVTGTVRPDWREVALDGLEAVLTINGAVVVRQCGGHPTVDPLLPAIALVNALRASTGVRAGQIITTGTYTGLHFGQPGDKVMVDFTGFGTAEIHLLGE